MEDSVYELVDDRRFSNGWISKYSDFVSGEQIKLRRLHFGLINKQNGSSQTGTDIRTQAWSGRTRYKILVKACI